MASALFSIQKRGCLMGRMSRPLVSMAVIASMLLLAMGAASLGDTRTVFSDGSGTALLGFPRDGGNNSTSVDLPSGVEVAAATVDLEGVPVDLDNENLLIDFRKPAGSTAWSGTTQTVPPDKKPSNYESINATGDPGLQVNNDDNYMSAQGNNAAAYEMFEFYVGDANITNFTLYWKGMGSSTPKMGFSGVNIKLYMWNPATSLWENYYSYARPSIMEMDKEVLFDCTVDPDHYVDARGDITMLATVSAATFQTTTMDTDYISLAYVGKARLWPQNLRLDVGGDGSIEWNMSGRLQTKTTVSGPQFVAGLQRAVDASAGPTVTIPFKFLSAGGGSLFVSNLTIRYGPKDLPPSQNGTIPDLHMDEDTNATLLDLWDHFVDDKGAAPLKFTIVYQQDQSKVVARMNADGHRVDFSTGTRYWFGAEKFRVRATDERGQWAESNNFTVNVRFVDHPPVLEQVGGLHAVQGAPFEYTFTATDPDMAFNQNESLNFSIDTSLLSINSSSGRAWFTPQNKDVGVHNISVTVMDRFGAKASMNVTLAVENINDPPRLVHSVPDNQFGVREDARFVFKFNATDPDLELGLDQLNFSTSSDLFNISADGLVDFTPDDKDVGVHKFRITVTDKGGLKDSANFTMNVVGVDEPPVILPIENITVEEDTNVRFHVNATDEDTGDVLIFTVDSPLAQIDRAGWVTFRADDKDVGVLVITITVRDRANLTARASFTVTVLPVEEPPANVAIKSLQNGTKFKQGAEIVLDGTATDEDGDELGYSWYSDGNVIGQGQNISVKNLRPGTHAIVLKVSDGNITVSSPPVQIEVTPKAQPSKGFIPAFGIGLLITVLGLTIIALHRKRG